jgi:hypothetical protein
MRFNIIHLSLHVLNSLFSSESVNFGKQADGQADSSLVASGSSNPVQELHCVIWPAAYAFNNCDPKFSTAKRGASEPHL